MKEFTIFTAQLDGVNFSPRNIYEEVIQNVKTILTTPKYSVPLDRNFGIDISFIDKPQNKVKAIIQSEIIQALRKYEKRCKILSVKYFGNLDGRLDAEVKIAI